MNDFIEDGILPTLFGVICVGAFLGSSGQGSGWQLLLFIMLMASPLLVLLGILILIQAIKNINWTENRRMMIVGIVWFLVSIIFSKTIYGESLQATYIENYDGDSITISLWPLPMPFQIMQARIFGIDSAEIKGKTPCEHEVAKKAKLFVRDRLIIAHKLELRDPRPDKYFRLLAKVFYDGHDLADELIKAGLAVEYHGEKKPSTNWCRKRSGK